ncbi:hypothetical protein ABIE76_000201 [Sinorhizobium fredii]
MDALNAWLAAAKIDSGSVFRAIDPKAVNDVVKRRVTMAGLEAEEFSAHGLRS